VILWFSGTGNSKYAAELIADILQDETVSLNDKIKEGTPASYTSEKPYVFVCPTYAWQIPHVVKEHILASDFAGSKQVYFILTCGGSIGNAGGPLGELAWEKGWELKGVTDLVMPENYVAMFDVPDEKESDEIIRAAARRCRWIARTIRCGGELPEKKVTMLGQLQSGIVNKGFYSCYVNAKGFYTTDACTGCGLCVKKCPLNNISLANGRPVWGKDCTHCMACICSCPTEAIEYKKASKGRRRYLCPAYEKQPAVYEEQRIMGKNGYEIPFCRNLNGEKKVVIVCHGYGSEKDSQNGIALLDELPKAGIGCVAFDLPAHGSSPADGSNLRISNCLDDIAAMEEWVHEQCPDAEIAYFGYSFGAYLTILYMMTRPHLGKQAFLRSAAIDMPSIFREDITRVRREQLESRGYCILDEDFVYGLKIVPGFADDFRKHDLLKLYHPGEGTFRMIHGADDDIALLSHAQRFAELSGSELKVLPGCKHLLNEEGAMEETVRYAIEFYRS